MDCQSIERALIQGDPLPPAAEGHLESCPACAALVQDEGALARCLAEEAAPGPPGDLEAILAAVAADTGPTAWLAGRSTPVRVGLALAVGIGILLGVGWLAPRWDLDAYPTPRMLSVLGALSVALVAVLRLTLRPLQRPAPSPVLGRLVLGSGFAVPFILALLPSALPARPPLTTAVAEAALACFSTGILLAVPVVLLVRRLDRRRGPPGPAGLLGVAAAGGLVGNLALQLHCPIPDPAHLAAGHAPIALGLAAALGLWWAGRRRRAGADRPQASPGRRPLV